MTLATVVSVQGRSTGRYYFEIEIVALEQNESVKSMRLGITRDSPLPDTASPSDNGVGVNANGGIDAEGVGTSDTIAALAAGDILGCAVDFNEADPDNVRVWFSRNGTFTGDPEAGTGFIGDGLVAVQSGTFYAGASIFREAAWTTALDVRLNARTAQFNDPPPTGFSPWEDS